MLFKVKCFERARLQPCRKSGSRDNVTGADNQQERSVVRIRARLQPCRKGGKIDGALAPEVSPPALLESSETTCQIPTLTWVGKDIVRTAWRHAESGRNVHSSSQIKVLKGHGFSRAARSHPNCGFSRSGSEVQQSERNSLSGKFRPARMA